MTGRAISFGRKSIRGVDRSQVTEFFHDEVARQSADKHAIFGVLAKSVCCRNIPESFGLRELKLAERVVFTTNR